MATRRQREKRREKVSAQRYMDQHQSGFSSTAIKIPEGVKMYKPKAGARRLEIIPFTAGEGNPFADADALYYERTFWVHRGIGADQNSYVCLAKTKGERCPICEHRAKLAKDPDADEDLIKDLAPKERQLWNVYDHSQSDLGVQLWEVSHHLFGKRLQAEIRNADEDDGYMYFADPEEGFTLRVTFEDKSFAGNNFVEAESINFKARKEPIDEALLEAATCLDDILICESYAKLKEIFLQSPKEDSDEDEDDEEEEKPRGKRKPATKAAPKSTKKKGRPVEDDEDDEDEDESEDDDDEEDDDEGEVDEDEDDDAGDEDDTEDEDDEPEDDEEDDDEVTDGFEEGDFVVYGKAGECEIVSISKDGKTAVLEDENGKTLKGVPTAKLKPASVDEDDDDEDDDEDEPAPKKKPAASKKGTASPPKRTPAKGRK